MNTIVLVIAVGLLVMAFEYYIPVASLLYSVGCAFFVQHKFLSSCLLRFNMAPCCLDLPSIATYIHKQVAGGWKIHR